MTGRFIAVVGPSGVGKDSVMMALAAQEPRVTLVRRVISRPTDAGGEDFEGVTEAEFCDRRDQGDFALWWQAHGLFYGIPTSVDTALAAGQDVLANLSRGVLPQMASRFTQTDILVLTAPAELLAARLAMRGREDALDIARRLSRADFALPNGIVAHQVSNAGPLAQTVAAVRDALYPVSLKRSI